MLLLFIGIILAFLAVPNWVTDVTMGFVSINTRNAQNLYILGYALIVGCAAMVYILALPTVVAAYMVERMERGNGIMRLKNGFLVFVGERDSEGYRRRDFYTYTEEGVVRVYSLGTLGEVFKAIFYGKPVWKWAIQYQTADTNEIEEVRSVLGAAYPEELLLLP